MPRLRAVLACLALTAAGCHSPGGKVGAALVTVSAFSGFVYGVACADYTSSDHHCESGNANALGVLIVVGLVGGLALWIYSEHTYHPADPDPPGPTPTAGPAVIPGAALFEPFEPSDPRAHQLAVQAHNAAARGQCASIPGLAKRVRELDANYYEHVFATDPPIARCL